MIKPFFRDFIRFVRVETSLFITGISISGYLMLSGPGLPLLYLFLCMVFGSGASYALNQMTDKDEDRINNEKINLLASNVSGWMIIALFSSLAILFSSVLPILSTSIFLVCFFLSMLYSVARVKKVFLLKNFYTGLNMASAFLVGTTAVIPIAMNTLYYTFFVFMFGFIINLLGDIRGHEGDKLSGVRTIPVLFGIETAKKVAYALSFVTSVFMLTLNASLFYILIPFILLFSFFLSKNNMKGARTSMISSFSVLPFFLLILGSFGGL